MIFNKSKKENFKNKKYLWVIFIIIIISATSLAIMQSFNKNNAAGGKDLKTPKLSQEENYSVQTYLSESSLELETGDRYVGNKEAGLKVFVYEDYDDAFSAKLATDVNKIIKESGDEAVFVFRPFVSLFNNSGKKALALDCIKNTNNWQILREAFVRDLNEHKKSSLDNIISDSGISEEGLYACIAKAEKSGRLEELRKENADNNITGSPTIVIGDELILGARPYNDYVDHEGERVEGLKNLVNRVLYKSKE